MSALSVWIQRTMKTMPQDKLVKTAEEILLQTSKLSEQLKERSIVPPNSLAIGEHSDLWDTHDSAITSIRSTILALTTQLDALLEGPHGFLHEYISYNWEHGALYALLEHDVLEQIPLDGTPVGYAQLAKEVGLQPEKLLRICRLVATAGILQEIEEGFFAHTAISETLVRDEGYKNFIGFQLFETRVASANLADSLRKKNPFWTGGSAFDHAWGMPMYDWHAKHPEKGKRFAQAMQSGANKYGFLDLDPGNGMIIEWFTNNQSSNKEDRAALVVEVSGKAGAFSSQLATKFPDLSFEVQDSTAELLQRGEKSLVSELVDRVHFKKRDLFAARSIEEIGGKKSLAPIVYLIRGVLWCLEDSEAIKLLQSFIPVMQRREKALLVINDLVSLAFGSFEPHAERAFRRRDVTLMTMHNVKQRTAAEWATLISSACPQFKVTYKEVYSSHSCRGLWEVQLENKGEKMASRAR